MLHIGSSAPAAPGPGAGERDPCAKGATSGQRGQTEEDLVQVVPTKLRSRGQKYLWCGWAVRAYAPTSLHMQMHRRRVRYAPASCWVCTGVVLGMHRRRFRSVGCGRRQLELANALERGKDIHCGPPSSVWPRLRRGERRRAHISCSGPDRLRYLMCMGGVLRRGARSVPRPSLLNGETAPLGRGRERETTCAMVFGC